MTFRNTVLAAAAMLSAASAHIIMEKPVPYNRPNVDNGPLNAQQFPCKSQLGFDVTEVTKMSVGEPRLMEWSGSAVHNGGLCQLSVALTRNPTPDTVFKVIKTIEGGCPGLDSAVAPDISYTLPDSIPSGEATFAWTWMPTSSGGPEFYMNCAPIEVEGGASDDSGFSQLPDMLVANLPGLTDCTQTVNTVLEAPNPGEDVEFRGEYPMAPPTGNCGGSGGSAPIVPRSSSIALEPTAVPSAAPSGSPSAVPTAVPSNPGGIFAPSASSTITTIVTVTGTPVPQPSATGGAPVVSAQPSATGGAPVATPVPTGGAPSGGNTCSENGAIVCNGDSQFGICDNGNVVWQPVAPGTTCQNGSIKKRAFYGRYARAAY